VRKTVESNANVNIQVSYFNVGSKFAWFLLSSLSLFLLFVFHLHNNMYNYSSFCAGDYDVNTFNFLWFDETHLFSRGIFGIMN